MRGSVEKCPVCYGKGWMPKEFYDPESRYRTDGDDRETCHGCGGSGVVIIPGTSTYWPPSSEKVGG